MSSGNGSGPSTNGSSGTGSTDGGTEEAVQAPTGEGARGAFGGRWGAAGMPLDRSKDLGGSVRRLAGRLAPERLGVVLVVGLAIVSVSLPVLGPRILGNATQTIVDGVVSTMKGGPGIDFGQLHRILLTAVGVYLAGTVLSYLQGYVLAGVVQRSMFRLRADVEEKLNRMPLGYVDRQPRGDLLSRVTNDIDNLAQSLQQTLSQLLTSTLTIVGVLAMMFWISWELALVAAVMIPASLGTMRFITSRSKQRFVDQWRHTGSLNAQVEEAFTGHSVVKVFGRQQDVEARFRVKNDELFEASGAARFMSGSIQPGVMVRGNVN